VKRTYRQVLAYQAFVNDYEHYRKQQEIMLQLDPRINLVFKDLNNKNK
jgi:hypothetical protein